MGIPGRKDENPDEHDEAGTSHIVLTGEPAPGRHSKKDGTVRELYERITESTVDFPREVLAPDVWDKRESGGYILRDDAKAKILEYIGMYPGEDLMSLLGDLHIIGSICTNLYKEDTDVDVHIVPAEGAITGDAEEFQKMVKTWSHENPVYLGEHPVELYIQLIPEQEMLSDGVYDVMDDVWKKGPRMYPLHYNPYTVFSDVLGRVQDFAKEADINMGELRRDVIDYAVVQDAAQKLPKEYRQKLRDELAKKVEEIEADIGNLLKDKKEWVELRRGSSRPTAQQALDDVDLVKKWGDSNAIFKFLDRYEYIRVITELERMLSDDNLSGEELNVIKGMFGVQ